jgi:hypothetical protein
MKQLAIILVMLGIFSAAGFAETVICGHVTLVDPGVEIRSVRLVSPVPAVVNFPLVAGDIIVTPADGRCEIQFDNGTIMRLDRDSELSIEQVSTPSLTSNREITTLDLGRGQIYTICNTYKREMYQVTTPKAAFWMDRGSKNIIGMNAGRSFLQVLSGSVRALYGGDSSNLKEERIGRGRDCQIDGDARNAEIRDTIQPGSEFQVWNESVNSRFEELHRGIAVVPGPIYRHSQAVVYWAENWSSLYGKWVYNDLFGYVWQPAEGLLKELRPFYNASWVEIDGQRMWVPEEPWGFIPANLGVWHWTSTGGWVWIPMEEKNEKICYNATRPYLSPFCGSTLVLYDMLNSLHFFSDSDSTWFAFNHHPVYSGMPQPLADCVRTIARLSVQQQRELLPKPAVALPHPVTALVAPLARGEETKLHIAGTGSAKAIQKMDPVRQANERPNWNPDRSWAERRSVQVRFDRSSNSYVCPKLKINSRQIDSFTQFALRTMRSDRIHEAVQAVQNDTRQSDGGVFSATQVAGKSAEKSAAATQVEGSKHQKEGHK